MSIAIVDYGMGNLRSLRNAFEFVGASVDLVTTPEAVLASTHLVLPGVGAFGRAMQNLSSLRLVESLRERARSGKPLLGICLGMQLLAAKGLEFGEHEGLGIVPGTVRPIEPGPTLRVPHVGWNDVTWTERGRSFVGPMRTRDFYFVHSFCFATDNPEDVAATTEYGHTFASAVARANVLGVQFHPEKSQAAGLELLELFASSNGGSEVRRAQG